MFPAGITAANFITLGYWRNWRWTGGLLGGLVLAASLLLGWTLRYFYAEIVW